MQDEEKRKILKMLISPNSERTPSRNINDFMSLADKTIKAAKSAENLCTSNQVNINSFMSVGNCGRKLFINKTKYFCSDSVTKYERDS